MAGLEDYHIYHLQLFIIMSISQTALQKLLMYLSLQIGPKTLKDPGASLSSIFTNYKDSNQISKLFSNVTTNSVVYKDFTTDPKILQPSINIHKLDVTACSNILRKISVFPTSEKYFKGYSCSEPKHISQKCCVHCDHKCPVCAKPKCKNKSSCCKTGGQCSHKCIGCNANQFECINIKYICCTKCVKPLCLYCFLKKNSLNNCEKLYKSFLQKMKFGICDEHELRLSLHMILVYRNFVMHLTHGQCEDMGSGKLLSYDLPSYCLSWNNVRDTIWNATLTILNYLCYNANLALTHFELINYKEILLNLNSITKDELLKIYGTKIQSFLELEQNIEMQKTLECMAKKIDNIYYSKQILKIKVKYVFNKLVDFDYDCEEAVKMTKSFESNWKKLGKDVEVNLSSVDSVMEKIESTVVLFTIKAKSSDTFTENLKDGHSEESKKLWNELKTLTEENLEFARVVKRLSWEFGSIIIRMLICKNLGECLTSKQREKVESTLPKLCQQLELEHSEIKCNAKLLDTRESYKEKDEIVVSFILRANNNTTINKLQNLNKNPTEYFFQEFLSNGKLYLFVRC